MMPLAVKRACQHGAFYNISILAQALAFGNPARALTGGKFGVKLLREFGEKGGGLSARERPKRKEVGEGFDVPG
jgi:hypothetical protein